MSGFDFDALRDPDAPLPGGRERAGVDARARQLHVRQLRNRVTVSTTALVLVAGAVFGVVALQRKSGPQIIVGGSGVTTSMPATSVATSTSTGHGVVDATTSTTATTMPSVTSSDSAQSSSLAS